jgi:hypothetical protein
MIEVHVGVMGVGCVKSSQTHRILQQSCNRPVRLRRLDAPYTVTPLREIKGDLYVGTTKPRPGQWP